MAKHPSTVAFLSLAFLVACTTPPGGETTNPPDYAAFLQACKDATTDALVVNLAAHPDDEAGRSLVFLRRKFGIRTVTVYSTCGEGGQNAIGPEIGLDLARIRTRETLAAAEYTGTRVRWLGFSDFGYSKTAKETFKVWGKEKYVARLTTILAEELPDLVLTNHSPEQGHGHHRASVIAVRELLEEQAKSGRVVPVYQRASSRRPRPASASGTGRPSGRPGARTPSTRARPTPDIKFDVGEVDYMTGMTYSRQASLGWRQHRTQGMMGAFSSSRSTPDSWRMVHPKKGNGARFFAFLGSVFDEPAFEKVAKDKSVDVDKLKADFAEFHKVRPPADHVSRARRLLPVLELLAGGLTEGLPARRLQRRIDALQRVVLEGSGVKITATLARQKLSRESEGFVDIRVTRSTRGGVRSLTATLGAKTTEGKDGHVSVPFGPLRGIDTVSVAPSWFRPQIRFEVDGQTITRRLAVRYTAVPRVALELKRPVRFVPTTSIGKKIEASVQIVWNGEKTLDSSLRVESSNGFDVKVDDASIRMASSTRAERRVHVQLPATPLNGEEAIVLALDSGKSELRLRPVDVKASPDLFVGLIRGPDDTLKLALSDLDIRFEELDAKALPNADLSKFSTVVIDIRAYRTRRDLRTQRDRILAACKSGARVLCFYHKPSEWNATKERPLLAPFPLSVGRSRVCEEDAKVTLKDPGHRIWNHPNKVVVADFDGWVQERGLNFPSKWDNSWQPLMQMNDTGEKPLEGAMLYAKHGKGDYIYCSLALYRQLRRGHTGAARLLVNLLSR